MRQATQFDYVIVGAGSAGCVLAARLSEDSNTRVALIEAGAGRQIIRPSLIQRAGHSLLARRLIGTTARALNCRQPGADMIGRAGRLSAAPAA